MSWINDTTYILLKKMLDVCALRHRVIANNIANVDTPGFKSRRVVFEEKLRSLLRRNIDGKKLKSLTPTIYVDTSQVMREDFNNVDIEKEMVRLSMNALRYDLYVQLLSGKLERIKEAIKGR
ncbi:flagellar basal body rod protein FlgB [Candidatus Aerophobetes bacterium]|uniref:Flagellar basal body rod protein FlgB n=1 Tax=Aerophobetes bacterium TaxID=2030807 RepID=A0A7V5HXX3_UNCAE|nr:flagellar basal body rod protein FlgB [Candidatus Aerophobetes bacterium]HHF97929.1 flagellar basal body rod protein FlgB [Candidatus Aerophobetes bacterium]